MTDQRTFRQPGVMRQACIGLHPGPGTSKTVWETEKTVLWLYPWVRLFQDYRTTWEQGSLCVRRPPGGLFILSGADFLRTLLFGWLPLSLQLSPFSPTLFLWDSQRWLLRFPMFRSTYLTCCQPLKILLSALTCVTWLVGRCPAKPKVSCSGHMREATSCISLSHPCFSPSLSTPSFPLSKKINIFF